jgi:hypothetical protein
MTEALINLLESCERERAMLQRQLDMLLAGKFRSGENHGSGWVDTTQQNIAATKASIEVYDQIIADYGAKFV